MDQGELTDLITAAVSEGVCDETILPALEGESTIESGQVSPASLLHTYVRRLRRTREGTDLYRDTARLVDFLRAYEGESISMITIRPARGGFRLLLADPNESKVLFWMRMFDQSEAR